MRLLFTNFHQGDGGGHTTYVTTLARVLAERHRVVVAAPGGSRLLAEAAGVPGVRAVAQTFPNGLRGWPALAAARRALAALIREEAIEVVHANGSADHRLVMGACAGLHPRPRIVFTKHNSKPLTGIGHAWRARRGTDAVIAVCEFTRAALAASPYRRCRLATVANGVDTDRYTPWPDAAARSARRRWCEDDDILLLGSNAGTARYKGWMDMVEALALLPAPLRRRVQVLVAGIPPDDAARARIADLGLQDQVRSVGMLDDVRPLVAALDAGFVLSHAVETISFACREMMAMGKPVLVTDYAGLPENIVPGRDGWTVPVRAPAAIAAWIEERLADRAGLASAGHAARAHAEAEFGLARFAAATEAVYADVLAR